MDDPSDDSSVPASVCGLWALSGLVALLGLCFQPGSPWWMDDGMSLTGVLTVFPGSVAILCGAFHGLSGILRPIFGLDRSRLLLFGAFALAAWAGWISGAQMGGYGAHVPYLVCAVVAARSVLAFRQPRDVMARRPSPRRTAFFAAAECFVAGVVAGSGTSVPAGFLLLVWAITWSDDAWFHTGVAVECRACGTEYETRPGDHCVVCGASPDQIRKRFIALPAPTGPAAVQPGDFEKPHHG